ncbi:hypothetical protein C8R46DRAFT_1108038 [Mycena filopes]|nr:hypothetical protein C8R46DRAFT_1108038 [Mycena filopes]
MHPKLPRELEREIFTVSAESTGPQLSHPQSLILVARRVQIWITPVLYRSFVVTQKQPVRSLRRTSSEFRQFLLPSHSAVAGHVRNLCLHSWRDASELVDCIQLCTGTKRLALFGSAALVPGLLTALEGMPLQDLSMHLSCLFGDLKPDFGHRLFSQLTHLNIRDGAGDWTSLSELPSLTHLSFAYWQPAPIFDDILAKCQNLEAFVYTGSYMPRRRPSFVDDPRTVVILVSNGREDWEVGIIGGEDYWTKADKFLEQRRQGKVGGLP